MKMLFEYIAYTLMEPMAAERQYYRIEKAIFTLNQMPERFQRYEKEPWWSRNLRVMPVDNYLVFYTVDIKSKAVIVIRVLYSARNIEKELDSI
ncbi:MAG: type II toxin-antitoxin system RelE/ParE family toxin [Clostridiales bacterium]|nr:type II toxin-antitoxin system RelE/ParE family toxin [Clostridiales bacterium]